MLVLSLVSAIAIVLSAVVYPTNASFGNQNLSVISKNASHSVGRVNRNNSPNGTCTDFQLRLDEKQSSITPRDRDEKIIWCRDGVTTFVKLLFGISAGQPSTFDILLTGAIGVLTDQVRQHGGEMVVKTQTGEVFVYNGAVRGLFLRVWHLKRNNPITWLVLQNAVSLLKECMFDTRRFGPVSFQIFDRTNPEPCGEGVIVLDLVEVANSNLKDWTVAGTFTRAQIQLTNHFIARSILQNLFDHANEVLDIYITHIQDTNPPISAEPDNWYYTLGGDQPMLVVSSLNSNDPQTWQVLKEGVQALFEYMQESNHWSCASSTTFDNDVKVGTVVIEPAVATSTAQRLKRRDLVSFDMTSRGH